MIWTPTATAVSLARQFRETGDPAILPIIGDAIEDGDGPQEWAERARVLGCDCDNGGIDTGGETPWGTTISVACPNCRGVGHIPPEPAIASMVLACGESRKCDRCGGTGAERKADSLGCRIKCYQCKGTPTASIELALRAVCEVPEWDAPRLLWADLIEPSDPRRAEFVRVQCELAAWKPEPEPRIKLVADLLDEQVYEFLDPRHADLRRERELLAERFMLAERFIDELPFGGATRRLTKHVGFKVFVGIDRDIDVIYRRGFVSEITCTWADWLRIADVAYWRPEQRETCGGRPVWNRDKWQCDRCGGFGPYELTAGEIHRCTGTVPRPFPATAQPLEVVRITDNPSERETGTISQIDWKTGLRSYYRWPGLRFEFAGQTRTFTVTSPSANGSSPSPSHPSESP